MSKLYLYSVFHANLQYDGIPEDDFSKVMDNSYWPILNMIEEFSIKLGLEFSSWTLKRMREIDASFVETVKKYWGQGKCEIIGSGCSQNIFPLIPARVNAYNLKTGFQEYQEILGRAPEVAFVNEGTYSGGLPELYQEAGIKTLIIEWENAIKYNEFPSEWFCQPQKIMGVNGAVLNLIWDSCNANRWFYDEYVRGRIDLEEYIAYLKTYHSKDEDRLFPFYIADWEILGYDIAAGGITRHSDIVRIRDLVKSLLREKWIKFFTPSNAIEKFPPKNEVRLETTEYPVITWCPDAYNAARWAVGEMDSINLNTQCYQLYDKLEKIEFLSRKYKDQMHAEKIKDLWQGLNFLWGSDLRTGKLITPDKVISCRNKMGASIADAGNLLRDYERQVDVKDDFALLNSGPVDWVDSPQVVPSNFSPRKHYKNLSIETDKGEIPSQMEEVKRYPDGSIRSCSFILMPKLKSGEVLQCRIVKHQGKKVNNEVTISNNKIEMSEVAIEFEKQGGRIKSLTFPQVSNQPLIGSYDFGLYTYPTADIQIKPTFDTLVSDNKPGELEIFDEEWSVRVSVRYKIDLGMIFLWKTYYVYLKEPRVDVEYRWFLKEAIEPVFFRLGSMTVNSKGFNREKLKYVTVNGGYSPEEFSLRGKTIKQDEFVGVQNEMFSNVFTSTPHCLGATEGWVDINDGEKGIMVFTDKAKKYSVPLVHYEENSKDYLCRITNSIGETSSGGKTQWKGYHRFYISYLGHRGDWRMARKSSLNLNHKLTTIFREDLEKA